MNKEEQREYDRLRYRKNPEKFKKTSKEYYYKNQEKQKKYSREKYKNRTEEEKIKQNKQRMLRYYKNIEKEKQKMRIYYERNKGRQKIKNKIYRENNKELIKKRRKEDYNKHKDSYIKRATIYRKNNPRSSLKYSLELQLSMNNVRKRDKNKCQWFGCNKNWKDGEIHVNHIFPRNEYPEYELVEQYMICYCKYHHALFHKARGDIKEYKLLRPKNRN